MVMQIGKQAALRRRATVDVIVERPDQATRRMRIRQVHGLAVWRPGQAVLHNQTIDDRRRQTRGLTVTIEFAIGSRQGHVEAHGAAPEAPLPIATTIVETHVGLQFGRLRQRLSLRTAIFLQAQAEQPTVHAGNQAAIGRRRDTADHFRQLPLTVLLASHATNQATGNINPIPGRLLGMPKRTFADGVALITQWYDCCLHLAHSMVSGLMTCDLRHTINASRGKSAKALPYRDEHSARSTARSSNHTTVISQPSLRLGTQNLMLFTRKSTRMGSPI